ncbi:MAG: ribonuclease PH [Verrucomicrobiota bacterium]
MTKKNKTISRVDQRTPDQLRPVKCRTKFAPAAYGSVLMSMGRTQIICGVSVEESVPRWMRIQRVTGGWLTAEYSMLPYSTTERSRRDVVAGKVSGRSSEIQRLIGRSLRAIVDLKKLGERTLWVDCDVLEADGGTRTASITGAYMAMRMAVKRLMKEGLIEEDPIIDSVAAISVGVVDGVPLLDLCYEEDVAAEVDMNVVMSGSGNLIEIQGTAEERPFTKTQFNRMLKLAEKGVEELTAFQVAKVK